MKLSTWCNNCSYMRHKWYNRQSCVNQRNRTRSCDQCAHWKMETIIQKCWFLYITTEMINIVILSVEIFFELSQALILIHSRSLWVVHNNECHWEHSDLLGHTWRANSAQVLQLFLHTHIYLSDVTVSSFLLSQDVVKQRVQQQMKKFWEDEIENNYVYFILIINFNCESSSVKISSTWR